MKKRLLSVVLTGAMVLSLVACGSSDVAPAAKEETTQAVVVTEKVETEKTTTETVVAETTQAATEAEEEDEENYETGDASLDKVRNEDGIGEKELLVVSFGTSYNDSRRLTVGAIEQKMEDEFSADFDIRRGFTSQIIIDHVKRRDNIAIDNVKEALDRAVNNGVKTLVVQPTHLMDGFEYNDLVDEVAQYADAFDKIAVGKPILTTDDDFMTVMKAITDATAEYANEETAICFMGHGTEAASNKVYAQMQQLLNDNGFNNYFIGTVEAEPSLEEVVALVKEAGYKKVVLEPLMIVAGDHANNDMAGDEEGSWKYLFEQEGIEVECLIRGLGELPAIQQLLADHAKEAIDSLDK